MEWQTVVSAVFTLLSVAANALAVGTIREGVQRRGVGVHRRATTSIRRALVRLRLRRPEEPRTGVALSGLTRITSSASGYALPPDLAEALRGYIGATREQLDRLAVTAREHGERLAAVEAARATAEARASEDDEEARAATAYVIAGAVFAVLALLPQVIA